MEATVRTGSSHDVGPCVELWTRVISARDGRQVSAQVAERARAAFTRPVVRFAVVGPAPEAFALTVRTEHRVALLSRICVDPARVSRGLGTALLADAVQHARDADLDRIDLDVRITNGRAIALYTRAGFVPVTGPRDHDGGDPVATWSLDLIGRGSAAAVDVETPRR